MQAGYCYLQNYKEILEPQIDPKMDPFETPEILVSS